MRNRIITGDVRAVLAGLRAGSVDVVITSPPYWGLRDYDCDGQLGSEKTLAEYIDNQVEVFRQVRRLLKPWGTLWLNMGDSYARDTKGGGSTGGKHAKGLHGSTGIGRNRQLTNLGNGNLMGQPWRLALALQADRWYLRDAIIWAKAVSFCETYSGSTMPESVNGWRWERCRLKMKGGARAKNAAQTESGRNGGPGVGSRKQRDAYYQEGMGGAQWQDCPGCSKCEKNGGYVLRKGAWRPTKAHEHLFLFAKSEQYYCDAEAVKEDASGNAHSRGKAGRGPDAAEIAYKTDTPGSGNRNNTDFQRYMADLPAAAGRNLRDVWTINPAPTNWEYCFACERLYGLSGYRRLKTVTVEIDDKEREMRVCSCGRHDSWVQHFATFPRALVEPCIRAGTSERGNCPKCGMPWVRVVERTGGTTGQSWHDHSRDGTAGQSQCSHVGGVGAQEAKQGNPYRVVDIDWRPSCDCGLAETVPAVVLDPFMGAGTTGLAAYELGRNYSGVELNPQYAAMARKRLAAAGEEYGLLD